MMERRHRHSHVDGLLLVVQLCRQPRQREEEIRQPVDVLEHLRIDLLGADERRDPALSAAAGGAGNVQARAGETAWKEGERDVIRCSYSA